MQNNFTLLLGLSLLFDLIQTGELLGPPEATNIGQT